MKNYLILIIGVLGISFSKAQIPQQNIRGIIVDKQSQSPLPGASLVLLNSNPLAGTTTDVEGRFEIKGVPIGRIGIKIDLLGYTPIILNNLILNSGKELVLNLSMEENITNLSEVMVSAGIDKKNPLNEMATVSTRSFNVDESNRYAGSLGDPSRMATNYAGVSVAGDSRNDIVIRGNSPMGLLWRLDGINIPNPNHFGSLGTTGGPVSMLNNNLLDNSDFMTGAFPAGYGNALSGAFDLKMRTGNNTKREFLGQVGYNGFELGAEGPFSKNSNASYLISYRYSTIGLMDLIGIKIGLSAIPQYQDLSFKIDLPTGIKYGRFTIFGIMGKSYIELLDKNKKEGDFTVSGIAEDTYFGSNMGVTGLSHKYFFNEKTFQTISLAASGTQNITKVDSLFNNKKDKMIRYGQKSAEEKYTFTYNVNSKINSKNTVNAGVIFDEYHFNYGDSIWYSNKYIKLLNFKGNAALLQPYVKWQHKFNEQLTLNTGVHYQHYFLNNSFSIEPRLGLKLKLTEAQSISLGTGMYSQLQPMSIYFYNTQYTDGTYKRTNENLGFSKSNHIVLAYDNSFAPNWRLKAETYYQHLYDIPVENSPSTFTTLNLGSDYYFNGVDSLQNKGTGKNYGLELTVEKFFSTNYYLLVTGSIFDSKYKGGNGVEHNTAFNGNYTLNALLGGEFNLDQSKKKILTFNAKVNYAGGKRYTSINLEQSNLRHQAVYEYDQAFERQYKDYSRVDIKIGYKINKKRITEEYAFDIQNIFNRKNIFQQIYNPGTQKIQTEYQLGIYPMMTYRVTF